jgi:hypothetical protein
MVYIVWFFFLLQSTEIPFKGSDEFECKLNMSFSTRSNENQPVVNYSETVAERDKRLASSPLPYLKINVVLVKLPATEVRAVLVGDGQTLRTKKVTQGDTFELDLGFTDDIKDGTSPREYEVLLQTKDRKPSSRITLSFSKNGDYLVNGVKRGKI